MTADQQHKLDLKFKGSRTYLHGTDIFDAMCKWTGAAKDIRQTVHRPLTTSLAVQELTSPKPANLGATFIADGKMWALLPTDDEVTERYPYDEDAIAERAVIFEGSACAHMDGSASFIETVVATNKVLLNHLLGEQGWWFTGIELKHLPKNPHEIFLTFKTESRLVKSSLVVDMEPIGSVYFMAR